MHLPPLAAIRAFEAVARHLSFTRAAEELGMTQAGVSYQIRLLEERLGGPLFLRRPREVRLTRLGEELARPTTEAFDLLRETYAPTEGRNTTLAITTPLSIATHWLSQRLGKFQFAHPELALRLESSDRMMDFSRDDFDAAIRYGKGDWPGVESHLLFDYTITPMLSPRLAEEAGVRVPEDLLKLPIIDSGNPDWGVWMGKAGVRYPELVPIPGLGLGSQVNEGRAAVAGQGVAMLTPRFFRFELATGSLIQPFSLTTTNGFAHWLVYPTTSRNRPAIRQFRSFLFDEIERENAELEASPTP
ncbi:LysR substrate-binding domain-containing protein [Paracoccus aminophilus]|uniref:Transcriptional regulator, LysR family n=1 Tax=Paracoccus aminophilus JCM 7686 TaxID=1367847 RepID=S5YXK0_PARAH|nr:LysR substrate-binding domain-containing protein [Paracoccus aminophilus]AGT09936.1 transcriptional regulator, LysR family [Paracoccus aminophilus JCM 7686]